MSGPVDRDNDVQQTVLDGAAAGLSRRRLLGGLVALVALGLPAESAARVGGGHRRSSSRRSSSSSRRSSSSSRRSSSSSRRSSSSSRRSSSSSRSRSSSGSSGGGGGGGGGGVVGLAIVLFVGGAFVLNVLKATADARQRRNLMRFDVDEPGPAPAGPPAPPFPEAIQEVDPLFSGAVFQEYAELTYTRVHALIGDPQRRATLATLLSDTAHREVLGSLPGGRRASLVTIGATRVHVAPTATRNRLVVDFFTNLTAHDGRLLEREERWSFSRPPGAKSAAPERLRAHACLACGATEDPGPTGTCPACGAARTEGGPQWRVSSVRIVYSGVAKDPELSLGGGDEPGLDAPTVRHPRLPARQKAFEARHPDVSLKSEKARLAAIFVQLQEAWSAGHWERARPYLSDALFTANRAWLDQLAARGQRNRTEDVVVTRVELCDVETDAWVETIKVRIFARCLDWTERRSDGAVVGGSKSQPRRFSEYWTFYRTVGARSAAADTLHCPSCGAPLDKMGETGVCGYCESKVSQGQFDWVASRIEQDEDADR